MVVFPHMQIKRRERRPVSNERGVALILVTFVIALATIIVVNLTYDTYMASRANLVAERSLQAEYLLKSVINLGRSLIKEDTSVENSRKDIWARFSNGQSLDPSILGLSVPGLQLEVEIDAEDAKIPVAKLVPRGSAGANKTWRAVLTCLFKGLGFDQDTNEVWKAPPFAGRFFNSEQVVSNLIDYMDTDTKSYDESDFQKGIEGELDEKKAFPNQPISELEELQNVPGFTPARLRRALPYLTTHGQKEKVNINLAARPVIRCMHPNMTDAFVDKIVEFRDGKEGPFSDQNTDELKAIVGDQVYGGSSENSLNMVTGYGDSNPYFQILAKVNYGNATFFMRSYVYRYNPGELPYIYSVELF